MLFSISLLTLLLANLARVVASPAHDSNANTTLAKRDWKKKCRGVTLCTEEGFKGSCKSWCYEPDKFEDMIHSMRTNLRSVKLEKGVDCWFVQMNQCTKFNILNRPMIFMAEPGGDIPLQRKGMLGCFICPSENADYLM
ncbi:hypothetical protein CMUS01_12270 [Colletotrichum musicola]|uniref:Uncharacterized protein n=1 Tax=Colletotrichum musicola TaxID=2175873 RepID=A0A8H6N1U1_9PEZI|nr:hypothetical protein CMUS01_12270 [Colletotrichum musicola]